MFLVISTYFLVINIFFNKSNNLVPPYFLPSANVNARELSVNLIVNSYIYR